jgi:hypothetical protein
MEIATAGRWRETINLDDLWEGDMTAVMVDGESVLLVNIDGTVRAYSNRCPHQASALDEGYLDGETLTCSKTPVGIRRPHWLRHQPARRAAQELRLPGR